MAVSGPRRVSSTLLSLMLSGRGLNPQTALAIAGGHWGVSDSKKPQLLSAGDAGEIMSRPNRSLGMSQRKILTVLRRRNGLAGAGGAEASRRCKPEHARFPPPIQAFRGFARQLSTRQPTKSVDNSTFEQVGKRSCGQRDRVSNSATRRQRAAACALALSAAMLAFRKGRWAGAGRPRPKDRWARLSAVPAVA
ncbi:hypothetical protein Bcep1808_2100 [Burkholderia vietnamiensis G4]|uniref:Uncharacterized protein n=1 Tax=Burkholderia vietnamiensis (strain G4 / LMG 22486) TaxID=269482 RepID=A4JFP9_BURVG|nr:hypothetical protein Bcep1808_2100 [Burkholderia vietnamiensis G4]